ncbi:hypothetical protein GCM10023149_31390 [Mucilaginibacter gynuensis]|uniref:GLPGLI family protein n=1 Tax=Mucilaginibacter gynuensis TaxID=1302236 RepID=A0ABP8GNT4_9SPHI
MTSNHKFLPVLISLTLLALAGKAQVHYTYLKAAKMVFVTPAGAEESDNKDHDTKINIKIQGTYGFISSETLYNEDKEFANDGSKNEVKLNVRTATRPFIPKSEFVSGKITFKIIPEGDDTWIFKPTLMLEYSDGSRGKFVCDNNLKVSKDNPVATMNWGGHVEEK